MPEQFGYKNLAIDDTTDADDSTYSSEKIVALLGDKLDVSVQSHIVDADGTLADATTKINAILTALETAGILNTS